VRLTVYYMALVKMMSQHTNAVIDALGNIVVGR